MRTMIFCVLSCILQLFFTNVFNCHIRSLNLVYDFYFFYYLKVIHYSCLSLRRYSLVSQIFCKFIFALLLTLVRFDIELTGVEVPDHTFSGCLILGHFLIYELLAGSAKRKWSIRHVFFTNNFSIDAPRLLRIYTEKPLLKSGN
jgi:hypothetical protein